MQQTKLLGFILSIIIIFSACQNETSKWDLQPLDLTSYGLPIIVQAPDSADVNLNIIAFEKGVTISKDDFTIEVELKDVYADPSKNIDSIVSKKIESIQSADNFDKILMTTPNSLIYSSNDTIIGLDHHFFFVALKNGKQFEFQEAPNVMANYTLEEIKEFHRAVELSLK